MAAITKKQKQPKKPIKRPSGKGRKVIAVSGKMEAALLNIANGISAATGEAFFKSLVQHLAKTLNVKYAFIGALAGKGYNAVKTIAVCTDGKIADNFEYKLANTPCENIVKKDLCCYPRNVQQMFPKDYHLSEMKIESYIGSPLSDSTGRILGLMALMDSRPLKNPALAESMLRIFAVRASAELERKQAEDKLRKFSHAVEQNPALIVITDPDGNIEYVNPRFTEKTGYSLEEVIGKNPRILQSGKTPVKTYKDLWNTIASGRIWQGEFLNKRKNGELFWEYAAISPIKDAGGNITHYIAVNEDITERKRLQEQLQHAQKVEAVGQLAGGVAHDFNNILTAITGFATLLHIKIENGNPMRSYVEQILASSERAANLTRSLLTFSRKQITNLRPVILNDIINSVMRLLPRVIREDIELKTILTEKPLTIMADSGQIEQVVMNLATNAQDAMPDGGVLTIEMSLAEMDNGFITTHGYGKAGIYGLISVADTGIGMDEKIKGGIFEPFFTTKEVGKGTGLGLAIVYGIVKEHNGYINVYSEIGHGAIFRIYLPLIMTEADEARPVEHIILPRGTETILLAEDDISVRNLMRTVLEEHGYRVIEASDGHEAIAKFRENKDRIQLVILDVIMPKKNGKEVYDEIKRLSPDMKTLFISGYTADIIRKKELQKEGLNFISKPISPVDILKKIRSVLDK